jgi:hypothetical protein
MIVFQSCSTGLLKFFDHAGAVERIRQDDLTHTHVPQECRACGVWHVVVRKQESA